MGGSSFYGTRKTNLQAVVPRYSDDGMDSDNDEADPNYSQYNRCYSSWWLSKRVMMINKLITQNYELRWTPIEGSSNQQLEGPTKT